MQDIERKKNAIPSDWLFDHNVEFKQLVTLYMLEPRMINIRQQ
jgi:hypothetical protein